MGRSFRVYLAAETVYGCKKCKNHLAVPESVMSTQFHGQFGKALLVHHLVNVDLGPPNEREMRTGLHLVRDCTCKVCGDPVGWKYDRAFNASEKYKEGHFILERQKISEIREDPSLWSSDKGGQTVIKVEMVR